jgi:rare lipoprotein A
MRKSWIAFVFSLFVINASSSQLKKKTEKEAKSKKEKSILIGDNGEDSSKYVGTASFYDEKFSGRKTATGDSYVQKKVSAACNILPLGTWVRVTNLKNMRSVIVQINDRLHWKNKRIVDLSLAGAQVLGYIKHGLAQVRLEVLSEGIALQ